MLSMYENRWAYSCLFVKVAGSVFLLAQYGWFHFGFCCSHFLAGVLFSFFPLFICCLFLQFCPACSIAVSNLRCLVVFFGCPSLLVSVFGNASNRLSWLSRESYWASPAGDASFAKSSYVVALSYTMPWLAALRRIAASGSCLGWFAAALLDPSK